MTKIKFGTDGWRAIIAQEYTTDNVARVATATADWILDSGKEKKAVVGHDCRFGGEMFAEVTAKILCEKGIKTYLAKGFVSTPMISLGTKELGAYAGVVITASHNPPSYNGFKLKSFYGGPSLPEYIQQVEDQIPENAKIPKTSLDEYEENGMLEYVDLESMYVEHVKKNFDLDAIRNADFKVAYDAMYGAGQNVIKRILPEAILLHAEYNPSFMGQAPEPLHKNLQELSEIVAKDKNIGCGLATDGDADRIGMYDEDGNFVDAHHIILLLIHYLHKYKGWNGKVVVAFSTSEKIKKLCKAYSLPYEVTKIGFKYICGHMIEEDVLVGGEESGGIAVKGHIPERDGIWDGLILMEFMAKTGKTMKQLIQEIYDVVGSFSYNRNDLHIDEDLKQQIIENCRNGKYEAFGDYTVENVEDLDGFKYHLGNDRSVMIRPSGTEPVLRVYAEAPDMKSVIRILESAKSTLLKK